MKTTDLRKYELSIIDRETNELVSKIGVKTHLKNKEDIITVFATVYAMAEGNENIARKIVKTMGDKILKDKTFKNIIKDMKKDYIFKLKEELKKQRKSLQK